MLNNFERLLLLRGVSIFQELRDDFLIRLSSVMEERAYPSKAMIFRQGDTGQSIYIIAAGQVSVQIARQEIAQLRRGDFFGEMSLFDAEPRSASASAIKPCTCLELTQSQLYEAINETPEIALKLIGFLSGRIRELNRANDHLRLQLNSKSSVAPTKMHPTTERRR